jgi:hypothetical protein
MEQFILKEENNSPTKQIWSVCCIQSNMKAYIITTSVDHERFTINVDAFYRTLSVDAPPYTGKRFLIKIVRKLVERYPHLAGGYVSLLSCGSPITPLTMSNKTKEDIIAEYGRYPNVMRLLDDMEGADPPYQSYGELYSFINNVYKLDRYYIDNFGLKAVDDSSFPLDGTILRGLVSQFGE